MLMRRILILCTLASILASCKYDSEEELYGICDTLNVNYSTVQPIFEANCISCHNASLNYKGIILESYADAVNAAETGRLRKAINHQSGVTPMPYQQNKLPECPVLKVTVWIDNGTPQ